MPMPARPSASTVFVILILAVASLLLIWNGYSRYQDYLAHEGLVGSRAVQAAGNEIALQVAELKRRVALFAGDAHGLIRLLALDPEDEKAQVALTEKVDQHFADRLAFTISSASGQTLIDDFDGLVGEQCLADIRAFAESDHPYEVHIHPQPGAYHFDIMSRWRTQEGARGVFFISFKPDLIARMLANTELPGHRLLVLLRRDPSLIEITSEGARDRLQRDFRLSPEERAALSFMRPVVGTAWAIADLPDTELHARVRGGIWRETGLFIVGLVVVTLLMLRFLELSERRRYAAEGALRRAYHELELRVNDRTERLTSANSALQSAVKERKNALRLLKEREATLQAILDTAVDAIIVIDEEGRIRSFNGAAEQMFGYGAEEVVGENVKMLMAEPHRERHDDYLHHYMETGERRIIGIGRTVDGRHRNGSTFPVELAVSEVDLGKSRLFAGILRIAREEVHGKAEDQVHPSSMERHGA